MGASVPPCATPVLNGVKLPGLRVVERAPTDPKSAIDVWGIDGADVELMRRLDKVLGNAACSVLATAHQLRKPFVQPRREVRNIAVMKFFGMGSIIVASKSLAALRDLYPKAKIHFVTFKSNKAILDIIKLSDENHFVDPSTPQSFLTSTLRVARDLRRAGQPLR